MDQFLERQVSKAGEIHSLKRHVSIKQIELLNNLPKDKVPGPDGYVGKFHPMIKEEVI
jgi:hypothetical protein